MYQKNPMKCLTGECRLSYVHLTKPYVSPDHPEQKPKYQVTLLIPKTDTATKADMDQAFNAAVENAVTECWKGVKPPIVAPKVHDGDGVRRDGTPYGKECKGCWVLNVSSATKPMVVSHTDHASQLPDQEIYSGMYARVTILFKGFASSGNRGIACYLGNIMKTKDGEPLGGGASSEEDFAGIDEVDPITGEIARK